MKWYWILAIVVGSIIVGYIVGKARQRAMLAVDRLKAQQKIMDELGKIDTQLGDTTTRISSSTRTTLQSYRKKLIGNLREISTAYQCCPADHPNGPVNGICANSQGVTVSASWCKVGGGLL